MQNASETLFTLKKVYYGEPVNVRDVGKMAGEKVGGALPLVSVVTPVYNDAAHLPECIESVLGQTYQNWDYTIVDNCSSDGSADVARQYAGRDPRIRVVQNEQFLRAVPNHNAALRCISPQSKYCKIVFADDWIFPRCLEEMIAVAEASPSVAIVGAYGLQGHEVMWTGLPYPSTVISGHAVCRRLLLEELYIFGTSTSVLYRSDLVRARDPFYNEANLHADMEVCVELLKTWDFGFVHQILTYKRVRPESLGAFTEEFNTLLAGYLHNLVVHGRDFLTQEEFDDALRRQVRKYYNFLAISLLHGHKDKKFWKYHKRKLEEAKIGLSYGRLGAALLVRLCRALLNPYETVGKMRTGRVRLIPQTAKESVEKTAGSQSARGPGEIARSSGHNAQGVTR